MGRYVKYGNVLSYFIGCCVRLKGKVSGKSPKLIETAFCTYL